MPKWNKLEKQIPNIYRRFGIDLMLYVYVQCMTKHLPGVPLKEAVEWFMKDYELEEDDFGEETARAKYHRLRKELLFDN